MLIIEHRLVTKAKPQAIWKLWSNLPEWPKWDHEIDWVTFEGPLKEGNWGTLKPIGGPKVKFKITQISPFQSFSNYSYLPFTKLTFSHTMASANGKTTIIHRAEISGLLSFLFVKIIGNKIKHGLPQAMENLARLAEG